MTAAYRASAAGGQNTASSTVAATITPAVGDLFLVFVAMSGNTSTPTCADNNGGSYSLVGTALYNTSAADQMAVFVGTSLLPNTTSTTVTVTMGSGTCAAGEAVVIAVSGMSKTGATAIRQSASQANQPAFTTPAPAFGSAALTANVCLSAIADGATSTIGATAPTGWTIRQNVNSGAGAAAADLDVATIDSGFTGTTVTWGSSVTFIWASFAVELDTSALPFVVARFPDTAALPFGMHASRQMAMAMAPLPILAVATAQKPPVFPPRVERPTMHASQQMATTVRAFPLGAAATAITEPKPPVFPDTVARPFLRPESQYATAISPFQIAAATTPMAFTWYPYAAARPVSQQNAAASGPANPERTSVIVDTEFPASVVRPWLAVANQLASIGRPVAPERTTVLADTEFPERATRAWLPVADQMVTSGTLPYAVGQPAQPSVYPDTAARPWLAPSNHLAVTELSPFQVVAAAAPAVTPPVYPDASRRLAVVPASFAVASPAPERTATIVDVDFPATVARPFLRPESQMVTAGRLPERTATVADVCFPSCVDRPWFPVASQRATAGAPYASAPFTSPVYPSDIARPAMRTAPSFALAPLPIVASIVTPVALAWFPDGVMRPTLRASQQLAAAALSPYFTVAPPAPPAIRTRDVHAVIVARAPNVRTIIARPVTARAIVRPAPVTAAPTVRVVIVPRRFQDP